MAELTSTILLDMTSTGLGVNGTGIGQTTLIGYTNNEFLYSTSGGYTMAVYGYGFDATSALDSSLITGVTITNNSTGESARITGLAVPFSLSNAAQASAQLADAVTLVSGNNLINGSNHNDTLQAYGGNDTINAGNGNDLILAGSGNDIINVISAHITETGGNYNISGIGANNTIVINGNGTNIVHGGDGSIVDNSKGDDILMALALGNHSITAGSGYDAITLRDGTVPGHIVNATITNFNVSKDIIILTEGAQMLTSADLSSVTSHIANNASGNAALTLGGETVTFIGVHAASLTASDFLLA